jgi:hypothetical protein
MMMTVTFKKQKVWLRPGAQAYTPSYLESSNQEDPVKSNPSEKFTGLYLNRWLVMVACTCHPICAEKQK